MTEKLSTDYNEEEPVGIISKINEIIDHINEQPQQSTLSPSEAIYAFCGWLASRKEKTVMSKSDLASTVADRIHEFFKANNLPEPTGDFMKKVTPVEEKKEEPKCRTCKFYKFNERSPVSSVCTKKEGFIGTYCVDRNYVSWEEKTEEPECLHVWMERQDSMDARCTKCEKTITMAEFRRLL